MWEEYINIKHSYFPSQMHCNDAIDHIISVSAITILPIFHEYLHQDRK